MIANLPRVVDTRCARCGHLITEHMAEGDHPDHPDKMPCLAGGCECVDFHWCVQLTCPICWSSR